MLLLHMIKCVSFVAKCFSFYLTVSVNFLSSCHFLVLTKLTLKYTQAWERMGSLHFIGASIMHGSTYNPIKPKLLNIF